MSGSLLISAHGLALGYGRVPVLSRLDWEVARGDCWFLLGPNGRGKSTLLKAVLGQLSTQGGTLEVACGREAIGFVPQRCDLNPALPTTVREFVTLGLVGLRVGRAETESRLQTTLALVRLADMAGKSYWALSGGQRQRALLARALIRKPTLLILDEPTNGLDVPSEEALLSCLDALRRQQPLTVLFVTHDLSLAARHATHVALFGETSVQCGPCADLLQPAHLERIFGLQIALEQRHVV